MEEYIKKFQTHAAYNSYMVGNNRVLPNVSYCSDYKDLHYNPDSQIPNNIIIYNANSKLPETTSDKTAGLHTNRFNTTIVSHTYENGVGTIEFDDDLTTIQAYAFYQAPINKIILPDSVTTFTTTNTCGAFYQCTNLEEIILPRYLTNISDCAFYGCSKLSSIIIPDFITSIGASAFYGCSGLTSIEMPNSVTSIGNCAFQDCSSLTSVTIGNGVTSIGEGAFRNCTNLNSITCNATTAPTIKDSTFASVPTNGILTVPIGSTGYNVWMGTSNFYLGKYNWTKVEQ